MKYIDVFVLLCLYYCVDELSFQTGSLGGTLNSFIIASCLEHDWFVDVGVIILGLCHSQEHLIGQKKSEQ